MRYVTLIIVLMVAMVAAHVPGFASRQGVDWCRTSTPDLLVQHLVNWYRVTLQYDVEPHLQLRTSLGISSVSPAEVAFVADSAVCRRASEAYAGELGSDTLPVSVVRVGPRYAVIRPLPNDCSIEVLFDTTLTQVVTRVGSC